MESGATDDFPTSENLQSAQMNVAQVLFRPAFLPKMPWELLYEERRRASKDPRVMKQIAEEDQWLGTTASGLWKRIRVFALPKNDWMMDKESFLQLLAANGVKGSQLMEKLFLIFDSYQRTGFLNGLILCKWLHLAITQSPLKERFVRHCFERFDKPVGEDDIPVALIQKCYLLTPEEVAARSSKKGKKRGGGGDNNKGGSPERSGSPDGRPEAMASGARYEHVDGLRKIIASWTSIADGSVTKISFPMFLEAFTNPANGEWVGTFFASIMECCAKYFAAPGGALPIVPLRWVRSIEPLPRSDAMFDADVVLLREIESTGVDPALAKEKKKKGRSASPKKEKKKK